MKSQFVVFVAICLGISSAQEAKPVSIALYYESLCGGCQYFINNQYYPAFKAIGSIMDVNLVPYGNADETMKGGKWVFSCQHGKEECFGNLIETCAIHFYPKVSVYFPFIHCIENSSSIPRKAAPSCAKKFKLDYSKIKDCANGKLGNRLEHDMALKTQALNPPNTYVPWVTLDGVHTEKIQDEAEDDLIGLVCKTYEGASKPEACQKKRVEENIVHPYQRCWKNQDSFIEENNIHITN